MAVARIATLVTVFLAVAAAQSVVTQEVITTDARPPTPVADVPLDLTCPTTANTDSVFLTANASHPDSVYTSYLAYEAIYNTQKVPQPPAGCSAAISNEDQITVQSICAATVPDGFIVISDFTVTLACGSSSRVQANIRINGTADDDVSVRNFEFGAWSAVPAPVPAPTPKLAPVAAPSKAPAPSPLIMPSPSPTPPPQCRGFVRPRCQMLIQSMSTCCNQTGIVTALPYADILFACSTEYTPPPAFQDCLIVEGPQEDEYELRQLNGGLGFEIIYGNGTAQYSGPITVKVNQTGSCALNISTNGNNIGCLYDGEVFRTIPQIEDFRFNVQDPESDQYFNWIANADDLPVLGSTSWLVHNNNASGRGCRTELQWQLPPFFFFNFANYTSNSTYGMTFACDSASGTTCTALNAPAAAPSLTASNRN